MANSKIDEVCIVCCMTNIGHFRAAGKLLDQHKGPLPTRLWVGLPTKMDAAQLTEEGYYSIFGKSGARIEIPGCSLCLGNQARVGDGANGYLASAELAAVASLLGRLPTPDENQFFMGQVDKTAADTYRYLNSVSISLLFSGYSGYEWPRYFLTTGISPSSILLLLTYPRFTQFYSYYSALSNAGIKPLVTIS
ncbi:MAG: hypothetical protein G5701_00215 [Serratia symbiotica]|nr:hypothetical protein [Serratia symbiotica]